jgi:hypothetical protein
MATTFHSTAFQSTTFALPAHEAPSVSLPHLKVTGPAPAFGFERCEDAGCSVGNEGIASSCGRTACPACGCSGTNLSTIELLDSAAQVRVRCTCGHSWQRGRLH